MKREWKPGDVVPRSIGGKPVVLRWNAVALTSLLRAVENEYTPGHRALVDSVRRALSDSPLVVIDPEDREQVEGLLRLLADALNWGPHNLQRESYRDAMQAALREFADPKPPKPEEPTGLGAVVEADMEDEEGKGFGPAKWASSEDGSWVCLTDGLVGTKSPWPFLQNVRVLSKGVQAGDPR